MLNPYYTQSETIRDKVKELLPNGLETTADMLLGVMSKSKDEQLRDTAAFIKASKKSEEIGMVFNFTMPKKYMEECPIKISVKMADSRYKK